MGRDATILIVGNHPVFHRILRDVIEKESRFKVAGEVSDGEKVLEQLVCLKPQMLIFDIDMPHLNGLETLRKVCEQNSKVKVIILTMYKEEEIFNAVMNLGASAYVFKEDAAHDVVTALEKVDRGDNFVSASLLEAGKRRSGRADQLLLCKSQIESLPPAERRVLKLIGEAFTSKEIAEQLNLSVKTVDNHRHNMCRKLKLHRLHSLLKFAFDNSRNME